MSETNSSESDLNLLLCCGHCDDGSGNSVYPYYGLAQHSHDYSVTGSVLGITKVEPENLWPPNFSEDPEAKGCGTYTHCLSCGAGAT